MRTNLLPYLALTTAVTLATVVPTTADAQRGTVAIATRINPDTPRIGVYLGGGGAGDTLGVEVTGVVAEGPAARAGITVGERIVEIDGVSLRVSRADAEDPMLAGLAQRRLVRELERRTAGDAVQLRIASTSGVLRTVSVTTIAARELEALTPDARVLLPLRERLSREGAREMEVAREAVERARRELERVRIRSDTAREEALRATIRLRDSVLVLHRDSGLARLRVVERMADSVLARVRVLGAPGAALGVTLSGAPSVRDTLGVFVSAVTAGGPAELAGVVEGERIARINDVDLRVPREDAGDAAASRARVNQLTREIGRLRAGDTVALTVVSGTRTREVRVTLVAARDLRGDVQWIWQPDGALRFRGPVRVPR